MCKTNSMNPGKDIFDGEEAANTYLRMHNGDLRISAVTTTPTTSTTPTTPTTSTTTSPTTTSTITAIAGTTTLQRTCYDVFSRSHSFQGFSSSVLTEATVLPQPDDSRGLTVNRNSYPMTSPTRTFSTPQSHNMLNRYISSHNAMVRARPMNPLLFTQQAYPNATWPHPNIPITSMFNQFLTSPLIQQTPAKTILTNVQVLYEPQQQSNENIEVLRTNHGMNNVVEDNDIHVHTIRSRDASNIGSRLETRPDKQLATQSLTSEENKEETTKSAQGAIQKRKVKKSTTHKTHPQYEKKKTISAPDFTQERMITNLASLMTHINSGIPISKRSEDGPKYEESEYAYYSGRERLVVGKIIKSCVEDRFLKGLETIVHLEEKSLDALLALTTDESEKTKELMKKFQNISVISESFTKLRDLGIFEDTHLKHSETVKSILHCIEYPKLDCEILNAHLKLFDASIEDHRRFLGFDADTGHTRMIDIIVMTSEKDYQAAKKFVKEIESLVVLQPVLIRVMLDTYYGDGGDSSIGFYEDFYSNAIYLFVFVTPHWKCERIKKYTSEAVLHDGMKKDDTIHRVVPIWTSSGIFQDKPFVFKPLKGVTYFHFLNDNTDKDCFELQIKVMVTKQRDRLNVNKY